MAKIYLAITGIQDAFFSKNKKDVESFMAKEAFISHNKPLEMEISDEHFEKLPQLCNNASKLKTYLVKVPDKYYEYSQKLINESPTPNNQRRRNIALIFTVDGNCYHSPSLNNLNSFYNKEPENYFFAPLDLSLSDDDYVKIDGYLEFLYNNF